VFNAPYGLDVRNFIWPGIDYALVVDPRRDSTPRLSD